MPERKCFKLQSRNMSNPRRKKQPQFRLFWQFFKSLFPYKKKYFAILSLSILTSALSLVNPYLSKLVIDRAFANRDLKLLIILACLGGGIFILSGLFGAAKDFLERYIRIKLNFDLNRKVFKRIKNLPLLYFQDKSTGEHLYKTSHDIEAVAGFLTSTPPEAVSLFPKLLLTLGILFFLNWKMALLSVVLSPFLYLPSYYFSRKMRKVWEELVNGFQDVFKNLGEFFSHISLIKAFGRDEMAVSLILRKMIANIRINLKNIKLEMASRFTFNTLSNAAVGLIAFFGGYLVIGNQMSLGTLSAIMVYLLQLNGLGSQFAHFFQTTVVGLVSCQRVAQILDEPEVINSGSKILKLKTTNLCFNKVSFGYKKGQYVLKDLSFDISGLKHLALVGSSGCGKTTIIYLALGLYQPWAGDILINQQSIRDIDLVSFRDQIGVVLEEPFLWNDSLANNIGYSRASANFKQIAQAARLAGADFIESLPQGFDTIIGENACKLSEGQKQRIAIARALIKEPKILIFDEAFSSLDSESEDAVISQIKHQLRDTLLITISHRLATVAKADKVYFFSSSGKLRIGNPDYFINQDQEFISLFSTQLRLKV